LFVAQIDVAITAPCAFVSPMGAVIIGLISGLIVVDQAKALIIKKHVRYLIIHQPVVCRYMPMVERRDLELVSFGCNVYELHLTEKVVVVQKSYDARQRCGSFPKCRAGGRTKVGKPECIVAGQPFVVNFNAIAHGLGRFIQLYDEVAMRMSCRFAILGNRFFFKFQPVIGILPGQRQYRIGGVYPKCVFSGTILGGGITTSKAQQNA